MLTAVLLLVSMFTLAFLDLLPGDPAVAIAGEGATDAQVLAVRDELGLSGSFIARYGHWLSAIARFDLGRSTVTQQPVVNAIRDRAPVTLELAIGALVIALLIAVPLGVTSAYRAGTRFDRAIGMVTSGMLSLPGFVVGLLLVFLLAVRNSVFPVTGWTPLTHSIGGNLRTAALPVLALSVQPAALFTRLLRNDMAAVLHEDYISAARARGLPTHQVVLRHALRPSSFSLVTVAGVTLGQLLGGTVIVEQIYALPGLGRLILDAIGSRDYVMVRGAIVVVSVGYVAINALVDVSYQFLDPRVKAGAAGAARR